MKLTVTTLAEWRRWTEGSVRCLHPMGGFPEGRLCNASRPCRRHDQDPLPLLLDEVDRLRDLVERAAGMLQATSDREARFAWALSLVNEIGPSRLCGAYLGDNDATTPQLTCIRMFGHEGACDNVRGDDP